MMTERRWNPIRLPVIHWPMNHRGQQIEQAFDEFLTSPWLSRSRDWQPKLDVTETDDAFETDADLPGVEVNEHAESCVASYGKSPAC